MSGLFQKIGSAVMRCGCCQRQPSTPNGSARSWWIAFAVGFGLIAPVFCLSVMGSEWFAAPPKPIGDGPDYENLAYHLWQGEGFLMDSGDPGWRALYVPQEEEYPVHLGPPERRYLSTARPPLYPLVIAGIYSVCGRGEIGMMAVHLTAALALAVACAMAVATTWQLLSRGTGRGQRIAAILGTGATLLLAGSNRTLLTYASDFLTEPWALLLTQCFVSVALWPCASVPDSTACLGSGISLRRAVGLGILLGCMVMVRSMFVLWIPFLCVLLVMYQTGSLGARLRPAAAMALVAVSVCMPWWVRNVSVTHSFMPLGTQGPTALLGGYNNSSLANGGEWQYEPELLLRGELLKIPVNAELSDGAFEVLVAREARRRVQVWARENIAQLPRLVGARIITHWNPYSGRSLLWKALFVAGAVTVVVRRQRESIWLLGLPLISTLVVGLLYTTGGRFLVPLYGLLFILSGIGVAAVFQACPGLRRTA